MRVATGTALGVAILGGTLIGCANSETGTPVGMSTTPESVIATTEPSQAQSVVVNCRRAPEVQPVEIILFCADGNGYVNTITWSSWESQSAKGTGTMNANDCTPDCADGKFVATPVTIDLSDPIGADSHFRDATVTYPDGRTETYKL